MLKTHLLEIISNGESSGVEFKSDNIRPEHLATEVVAMANLRGGMVLLGVEDDGSISGVRRKNLKQWVMNIFHQKIHPMILPFHEEVLLDRKRVAIISFAEGTSKPYVVRNKGREDVYIRIGSTSRLATREQQAWIRESRETIHVETSGVSGSSLNSLSLERLKDYFGRVLNDPDLPENSEAWEKFLCGLNYLTREVNGHTVCSMAGLLLFGISPRRFLRQSGIRLMVFDGPDKKYRALVDDVIDCPLVALWRMGRLEVPTLAESDFGLVERFAERLLPFVTEEPDGIDEGFRRERKWHYPREAIREAVINALVHRDWTRAVDIEVAVYSDRLEIISPGALPNSMTIEKMLAGQRSPRNPLLVDVMKDYGYIDARGMGVRTKIVPLMKAHTGREPVFESTDDYLKIVLFR